MQAGAGPGGDEQGVTLGVQSERRSGETAEWYSTSACWPTAREREPQGRPSSTRVEGRGEAIMIGRYSYPALLSGLPGFDWALPAHRIVGRLGMGPMVF